MDGAVGAHVLDMEDEVARVVDRADLLMDLLGNVEETWSTDLVVDGDVLGSFVMSFVEVVVVFEHVLLDLVAYFAGKVCERTFEWMAGERDGAVVCQYNPTQQSSLMSCLPRIEGGPSCQPLLTIEGASDGARYGLHNVSRRSLHVLAAELTMRAWCPLSNFIVHVYQNLLLIQ